MKAFPGKLVWVVALTVVAVGILAALLASRTDKRGPQLVAETRQTLRQQGFKTDLADFDFSTSSELRAREAILNATVPTNNFSEPFRDHPNLMEAVGSNSSVVVWRLPWLKKQYPSWPGNNDKLTWEEFRKAISSNSTPIDATCATILSGPIRFNLNAGDGKAMRLPHLALLKNLTQTLGSRMVLDLHDGNLDAAWTNLLAVTRLVTAWQVEPVEVSEFVHFNNATLAYNATWQALQTNGWSDEHLARLQQEWESANIFTNLPETVAFKCASDVAFCQQYRREYLEPRPTYKLLLIGSLQSPREMWYELLYLQNARDYLRHDVYEDQTDLLLFYRDLELELRTAAQAPTWAQMRQLPGVTNQILFRSKYRSPFQAMMNLHGIQMAFLSQGVGLLGRAADAEARRRILITAIALERYHGRHGSYPQTLAELAPEFLKAVPPDFMNGQLLRYRPTADGHFILYSVALDCVDHRGTLQAHEFETRFPGGATRFEALPPADIVWPPPASPAALQEEQRIQADKAQREMEAEQARYSRGRQLGTGREWKQSLLRASRVAQILATEWSPILPDEFFGGRPAVEVLRNPTSATNRLSLAELLTLRQVTAGPKPGDLVFEFPISYNVMAEQGFLLLLDADTNLATKFPDTGAKVQERSRAPNGDVLLTWHTIYDPPGLHALQVELVLHNEKGAEIWCRGPAIPVTTSNLCQFGLDSATYDVELGATFHARLPEKNGLFSIECVTTNGEHLKTLSGSTTNGEFKVVWNLVDDQGRRLHGETFNSIVHITLPDSGRSQTTRGP